MHLKLRVHLMSEGTWVLPGSLRGGILATGLPAPSPLLTLRREPGRRQQPGRRRGWRSPVPASRSPRHPHVRRLRRGLPPPPPPRTPGRGYLGGRDSPQPVGRPHAALAVGRRELPEPRRPRRALRGARAVLAGAFIRRREEPAAALEAGDELGILQAPQQLGHGAPGAARQRRRAHALGSHCPRRLGARRAGHSGRRAGGARGASQQVRRSGPSTAPRARARAGAQVAASTLRGARPPSLPSPRARKGSGGPWRPAGSQLGGGAQVSKLRLSLCHRAPSPFGLAPRCHLMGERPSTCRPAGVLSALHGLVPE